MCFIYFISYKAGLRNKIIDRGVFDIFKISSYFEIYLMIHDLTGAAVNSCFENLTFL